MEDSNDKKIINPLKYDDMYGSPEFIQKMFDEGAEYINNHLRTRFTTMPVDHIDIQVSEANPEYWNIGVVMMPQGHIASVSIKPSDYIGDERMMDQLASTVMDAYDMAWRNNRLDGCVVEPDNMGGIRFKTETAKDIADKKVRKEEVRVEKQKNVIDLDTVPTSNTKH